MADNGKLASTYGTATTEIWKVYRQVNETSAILTLLTIAHSVLADFPKAVKVYLSESDQDVTSMALDYILDSAGEHLSDDEDNFFEWTSSISPNDLRDWPFWVFEGNRGNCVGHLLVADLIETLTPLANALIDPMPTATDTAAITAWLRKEIS